MQLEIINDSLSVSEFTNKLKAHINALNVGDIYIKGEITTPNKSGQHAYFDLKDENATLSCCYFFFQRKLVQPREGEKVVVRGKVSYYASAKTAKVSFIVEEIIPYGEGELKKEFERIKAKLASEGYFDDEHKKPIPKFPNNVLILTSKNHAVIQDIVRNIRKKNNYIDIIVRDVRVQGSEVAKELSATLLKVDKLNYDVIIVARGGGSLGDLAPFYDENLVKTVYKMKTPIISAIGHETDHSLLDYVADIRASTPTEAALIVGFSIEDLKEKIRNILSNNKNILMSKYDKVAEKFKDNIHNITIGYRDLITLFQNKIKDKISKIDKQVNDKFNSIEQTLLKDMSNLKMLNPKKIIERGYYTISNEKGHILDISNIHLNDVLIVYGKGGKIKVSVIEKYKE